MIDPVSAGGQQLGWLPDTPQLWAAEIEEFPADNTSTTKTLAQQKGQCQKDIISSSLTP